jgi:2-polyprenyl-3-methyl-5-hydroxy-6-metoxy-1,4-benzoquinol methylase
MSGLPSIRPELRALILKALDADYTSESCQDAIQTGNHYQSIRLGEEITTGFRSPRDEFLDRISFDGKRVLDLGSNLGELSRSVRRRGAALVDGYEYDAFFIELANAVNAYNGVTRVSFFERDITDQTSYEDEYDIILAFSVYIYIRDLLSMIAAKTRELLVLETHRLDSNLEIEYLRTVQRYFPHFLVLGETEWGVVHDERETRAVIAFAKEPEPLSELAVRTSSQLRS